MADPVCPPDGQNSPCGFEASQNPDEFFAIFSPVRAHHQGYAGIFAAAFNEFGQIRFPKVFVPQFLLSDSGGTASIYLLNRSIRC